jgi:hypothetical protein
MTDQNARRRVRRGGGGGTGGAVYALGLIGALVYYIQHAVGFWGVVLAILKGLVWPAFLVYHLLRLSSG